MSVQLCYIEQQDMSVQLLYTSKQGHVCTNVIQTKRDMSVQLLYRPTGTGMYNCDTDQQGHVCTIVI